MLDLQPLPLDPAQPVRGPDLMRIEPAMMRIVGDLLRTSPDLLRMYRAHQRRDRERRVRDLNSQQIGLDSHHGDPDLLRTLGEMLLIWTE